MKYIAKFAIIVALAAIIGFCASCGTTISGPWGTASEDANGNLVVQPTGKPIVLPIAGKPIVVPAAPVATPAPVPAQ